MKSKTIKDINVIATYKIKPLIKDIKYTIIIQDE